MMVVGVWRRPGHPITRRKPEATGVLFLGQVPMPQGTTPVGPGSLVALTQATSPRFVGDVGSPNATGSSSEARRVPDARRQDTDMIPDTSPPAYAPTSWFRCGQDTSQELVPSYLGDPVGWLVSTHARSRLLADLAELSGLTRELSDALAPLRQRRSAHDPGRALVDLAVMLADGCEAISDLAVLRDQPELLGPVASTATAWRVLDAVDDDVRAALRVARAQARDRLWAQRDEVGEHGDECRRVKSFCTSSSPAARRPERRRQAAGPSAQPLSAGTAAPGADTPQPPGRPRSLPRGPQVARARPRPGPARAGGRRGLPERPGAALRPQGCSASPQATAASGRP